MMSKSLLVYTLVGLFLSGVIKFGLMEFQKMQINEDLFKGDDICKWDGVNCVSVKILLSDTTEEEQEAKMKLLFSSNPNKESSATDTTDNNDALVVAHDADEMVHKKSSSLEKKEFEINDWATYPHVVHPQGVMSPSLLDKMIRITVKVLHYFIARLNQFRYQAPWLQRSSIMSLPFWLVFAPSIYYYLVTLM